MQQPQSWSCLGHKLASSVDDTLASPVPMTGWPPLECWLHAGHGSVELAGWLAAMVLHIYVSWRDFT